MRRKVAIISLLIFCVFTSVAVIGFWREFYGYALYLTLDNRHTSEANVDIATKILQVLSYKKVPIRKEEEKLVKADGVLIKSVRMLNGENLLEIKSGKETRYEYFIENSKGELTLIGWAYY